MSWLPQGEYLEVLERVVVLCVDGVIQDEAGRYLLVKRKNEPFGNRWWVPGGRVHKGERLDAAFRRKMREELGVPVEDAAPIGYFELRHRRSDVGGFAHFVSVVFAARLSAPGVVLDQQSSDWGWFERLPARFRIHSWQPPAGALELAPARGARERP